MMLKMLVWVSLWTFVFGSLVWLLYVLDHGTQLKAWLLFEMGAFCIINMFNFNGWCRVFGMKAPR